MMDLLTEIYESMSRNKLRIALTGFSIAWGIFLLIVMLSAGDGLLTAMKKNFASNTDNIITVNPGFTSKTFEGLPKFRKVNLDENIANMLLTEFPGIVSQVVPAVTHSGTLSFGENSDNISMSGQNVDFLKSVKAKVIKGRTLNQLDLSEKRKVILVDQTCVDKLFRKHEDPIGRWVNMDGIPFQIIGLYKSDNSSNGGPVYAPITTVNILYNREGYFNSIRLIAEKLESRKANETFDKKINDKIADYRRFDKDDDWALWINNDYENYLQFSAVMTALDVLVWIIGIASLIAGIVGVSNIMLITVRERTREFGIRKAIGASPRSILCLVLLESIGITMLFGYIGMFLGYGLVKVVTMIVFASYPAAADVFANPSVNIYVALGANITMIIAGVIAGYIPAKRAVKIRPVEALAAL